MGLGLTSGFWWNISVIKAFSIALYCTTNVVTLHAKATNALSSFNRNSTRYVVHLEVLRWVLVKHIQDYEWSEDLVPIFDGRFLQILTSSASHVLICGIKAGLMMNRVKRSFWKFDPWRFRPVSIHAKQCFLWTYSRRPARPRRGASVYYHQVRERLDPSSVTVSDTNVHRFDHTVHLSSIYSMSGLRTGTWPSVECYWKYIFRRREPSSDFIEREP